MDSTLVGSFGGDRWKEWNGRFRDDVRRFLKSDRDTVINLRQRLVGSPDIYTEATSSAGAKHQFRDLSRRLHSQ